MTEVGGKYSDRVAMYIARRFSDRQIQVFREVQFGRSIVGKRRRVDVFITSGGRAAAIECKFQGSSGTAEEKIVYAIEDMRAAAVPGFICYSGDGFSDSMQHVLKACDIACFAEPLAGDCWELDHLLAAVFGWWDVFAGVDCSQLALFE